MSRLRTLNHSSTLLPVFPRVCVCGGGGGLVACPYPLKDQLCPPQDQRPTIQSRVSGQEREKGATENLLSMSKLKTKIKLKPFFFFFQVKCLKVIWAAEIKHVRQVVGKISHGVEELYRGSSLSYLAPVLAPNFIHCQLPR